jgi:2-polyprenyl-6-hydroxyphenyl methylase/3-demethylubiquinone-9 3-methyltransferase
MRFSFGKNWQSFSESINDNRISEAGRSLREWIGPLEGLSFLDIGCGSGLFSLCASIQGAAKVYAFDFDPESVECSRSLKAKYRNGDSLWEIDHADILDTSLPAKLGTFDVVYSWGVLHHTGNMQLAFEQVAKFVKPGGRLFISIYNDQGWLSKFWRFIKRQYNAGPIRRFIVKAVFIPQYIFRVMFYRLRTGRNPFAIFGEVNDRGMSFIHDVLDWLGGYPFEVATVEAVIKRFSEFGFEPLRTLKAHPSSCNQYLLHKRPVQP